MTVITAIVVRECTAHASDSFLTIATGDGQFEVKESRETKIVRVPAFRGIMAYWGLARYDTFNWSTLQFLRGCADEARQFASPEKFAQALRERLDFKIREMGLTDPGTAGIGIHFTAYEVVDGRRIPELFLISNFDDTRYAQLSAGGFHCSRETYIHFIGDSEPQRIHGDAPYRNQVYDALLTQRKMVVYNNGDPLLFNPVANAILDSIGEIRGRNALRNSDSFEIYREIAKSAVDIVSALQQRFVQHDRRPASGQSREEVLIGKRRIGGKTHALAVTPDGQYFPVSGD